MRIWLDVDDTGHLVAEDLIWMLANANLNRKEREAYMIVIRMYLTEEQWEQFIGEEV